MCKLILCLFLLVPIAFAQTTGTATLVRTGTDNTGAIVPGATVNIINTETQFAGTSTRGGFWDVGTAQPNHLLVFRLAW